MCVYICLYVIICLDVYFGDNYRIRCYRGILVILDVGGILVIV